MTEHLPLLPGSSWHVWRECLVRAAGFPIEGLAALAAPAYANAADELATARADGVSGDQLAWLDKAVAELADEAVTTEDATLRSIAAVPLFREAVTWQNRDARRWALDRLAASTPETARNQRFRGRRRTVAKYWQRYCAKNDSIGFFGPICWAVVTDSEEAVVAVPGPELLSSRTVFLERWCLEAYADLLARDEKVRLWLAPRRAISQHLEGRTVYRPPFPPAQLRAADASVLTLCDGERTAVEIARLAMDSDVGLRSQADVLLVLHDLAEQKLLTWQFELPMELHCERVLRAQLERIQDDTLRDPALTGLDRLEHGRSRIAAAAGDVAALDEALADLDQVFTELTGATPSHAHGQTYAGRTLVFEDTHRDLTVELGRGLLDMIGSALELLLDASRWLTGETARVYRDAFRLAYDAEVRPGAQTVELGELWPWVQGMLFGESERPVDGVIAEFAARWARVIGRDGVERRVQLTAEELRGFVATEFPGCGPAWAGARYISPDLQVDAPSLDAIRRGDFQVVLGELHTAWNTLDVSCFVAQHPDRRRLLDCLDADIPEPRVMPVHPADWPRRTARTNNALLRDHDLVLGWTDASLPSSGQLLRLGELLVESVDGELRVRTREGRGSFDPIELIGSFLSELVVDAYKTAFSAPDDDHVPRTTIDRLVICRETWRLPVGNMDFAEAKDEIDRFVGARRWRLRHGLPEHVFVGFAHETKPFGIDLSSPVQVEVLADAVRAARRQSGPDARVVVSEMLPDPSGAWLPDASGRRYVSELRLQFVDSAVSVAGRPNVLRRHAAPGPVA